MKRNPLTRCTIIWLFISAIILLILSVIALIIVFAVEHSWFSDTQGNSTNTQYQGHYGLWRLCLFQNQTCGSWFSVNEGISSSIERRLNEAKVGINAWQAIEIAFIFFTTSTLIITLISILFNRLRKGFHYYLAILSVFCAWPTVCVGIAGLFVFGFSVYNVSTSPRYLDWCFYVNLVAVILTFIATILLTIYVIFLKRPMNTEEDETVVGVFDEYNNYPSSLNPSSYVIVPRDKKKRSKAYEYPQAFVPNQYLPSGTSNNNNRNNINESSTDYVINPNSRIQPPYTSGISKQPPNPMLQQQSSLTPYGSSGFIPSVPVPLQSQYIPPPMTPYSQQQTQWNRNGNYNREFSNEYTQRNVYRPTLSNQIEQRQDSHVLHFYNGFDQFSTIDKNDGLSNRYHPSMRYDRNPPYYPQDDYEKSSV